MRNLISTASTSIEHLESRHLLSAGDLDLTFGNNGVVVDVVEASSAQIHDSAIMAGDKILVGGDIQRDGDDLSPHLLRRYNADGSLDQTFGDKGSVIGRFVDADERVDLLTVLPSGKIVTLITALHY